MKVVHLTSVHPALDTRIFQKECRSLAAAGYNVVLVAPNDDSQTVDGVRIRGIPKTRGRYRRMTQTVCQIYRVACQENADLYHLHDPELLPLVPLLRRRGKVVIFDMHETYPKQILTKSWIPRWLRRPTAAAMRLVESLILTNLPVVFAADCVAKDYPWIRKNTTVLNVPLHREMNTIISPRHEEPTLGYLGCINPLRSSITMLEALAELKDAGLTPRFEFIGNIQGINHGNELQTLVRLLRLSNVSFRGYTPPREAWNLAARWHVGLCLLKSSPNNMFAIQTKIYEYMTLGIPVLVASLPGCKQLVESMNCGLAVDPDNPKAIADAIRWFLEHPTEAAEMGKRGKEAVDNHYNWDHEASKLLKFYEEFLGHSLPSSHSLPQSPLDNSRRKQTQAA